eukprot:m.1424766 g.1424766  ORF g.1424766 m.1424766 type:complete len:54 (+) comp25062_c0_seq5:3769-3930(+)
MYVQLHRMDHTINVLAASNMYLSVAQRTIRFSLFEQTGHTPGSLSCVIKNLIH